MPYFRKRSYGKASKARKRVSNKRTNRKKAVKKRIARRKTVKPSKASSMVYYASPPRFTGIKRTQRVKMSYCWSTNGRTIDITDGGSGNFYYLHQFSLNSLYDPDITGAGHQPRYFDQWGGFYDRYRVNGAKLELDFSEGTGEGIAIYVWPSARSSTTKMTNGTDVVNDAYLLGLVGGTTITTSSTASWNKLQELPFIQCQRMDADSSSVLQTFGRYYNVNKLISLRDTDKSDLQGSMGNFGVGAAPTAEVLVNVLIVKDSNLVGTNSMGMNARLTYWATLSEPSTINTS